MAILQTNYFLSASFGLCLEIMVSVRDNPNPDLTLVPKLPRVHFCNGSNYMLLIMIGCPN